MPFSRRKLITITVAAALFFIVGCAGNPVRERGADFQPGERRWEVTGDYFARLGGPDDAAVDADPRRVDRGDIVFKRDIGGISKTGSDRESYFVESALAGVAGRLNDSLALPADITVNLKMCGKINAFYDPRERSITICRELAGHFKDLFKAAGYGESAARQKTKGVLTFVFMHELGHGLIDLYGIRLTGNEESAADRCGSFLCITKLGDSGVRAVLAAADAFAIESTKRGIVKQDSKYGHSFSEERFLNTLCMIYGSDPAGNSDLKRAGLLSEKEAARCSAEYSKVAIAWQDLLKPWSKD